MVVARQAQGTGPYPSRRRRVCNGHCRASSSTKACTTPASRSLPLTATVLPLQAALQQRDLQQRMVLMPHKCSARRHRTQQAAYSQHLVSSNQATIRQEGSSYQAPSRLRRGAQQHPLPVEMQRLTYITISSRSLQRRLHQTTRMHHHLLLLVALQRPRTSPPGGCSRHNMPLTALPDQRDSSVACSEQWCFNTTPWDRP